MKWFHSRPHGEGADVNLNPQVSLPQNWRLAAFVRLR